MIVAEWKYYYRSISRIRWYVRSVFSWSILTAFDTLCCEFSEKNMETKQTRWRSMAWDIVVKQTWVFVLVRSPYHSGPIRCVHIGSLSTTRCLCTSYPAVLHAILIVVPSWIHHIIRSHCQCKKRMLHMRKVSNTVLEDVTFWASWKSTYLRRENCEEYRRPCK